MDSGADSSDSLCTSFSFDFTLETPGLTCVFLVWYCLHFACRISHTFLGLDTFSFWLKSPLGPRSLSAMGETGPPLRLMTPFGRAFLRAPDFVRRALLKQRIAPTQSDGELLLTMCYDENIPVGGASTPHLMPQDDLVSMATDALSALLLAVPGGKPSLGGRLQSTGRQDNWATFSTIPPCLPPPVPK